MNGFPDFGPKINSVRSFSERRWVLWYAIIVMLVTTVPYLLGFSKEGMDWRFAGFVFGVEDGNSYIAKMLSGTAGSWLFRTPYTALPQRGTLIFLPYILLGKLASPPAIHEQLVVLYHLLRFVAGILFLFSTYEFIAFFIGSIFLRRVGLILASLGGGLGWILILFGRDTLFNSLPLEFYSPESFGFLSLYGIPHLALARALLLWGLIEYLRGLRIQKVRSLWFHGLKVGSIWLLTGLVQPLTGMVVGAIVIIYLGALGFWQLWLSFRKNQNNWKVWRKSVFLAMVAGLCPLPFVLYNILAFNLDPVLKSWTVQSFLPSPHPFHYFLAYGLLFPFCAIGAAKYMKENQWMAWFPVAWILFLPVLAYAPFDLQRRLLEGIWSAFVILSLKSFESRMPASPITLDKRWLGLFLLAFPSTFMLIAGGMNVAAHASKPLFRPREEVAAFQFLAKEADPFAVVLSSYQTGNVLPAWAPVRVVIGHGPESVAIKQLEPLVKSFFERSATNRQRIELLQNSGVDYVFWGPEERSLGKWNPKTASYLKPVYDQDGYVVLKVEEGLGN
jgi:hypothetical protein